MAPIRDAQKTYGSRALIAAILIGLILMAAGYKPQAKGLILGCLFSIVNFVLIGETLPLRVGRSRRGAFAISMASIFFRYAIMAIPLIAAIYTDRFDVFAVIPGLFMVQCVILAEQFISMLPLGKMRKTGRAGGKV